MTGLRLLHRLAKVLPNGPPLADPLFVARNPFSKAETDHRYVRALLSYALPQALSGAW
jgi:hypothetical protein